MFHPFDRSYHALRPILIVVCLTTVIAMGGCTKSVKKVSYINDESASLQALSPNDDLATLQDKSVQELVTAGFVYLSNQNLKIAQLHFTTAINKDPKMVAAYLGLGRIEILKGNYKGALAAFSRAEELQPDSLPALVGQAQALRSEGKLDAAIKKINAAMMVDPADISVLNELALIYDLMGKETLSAPLYLEIVNKAPDQASAHNNLGLNYMVRGEYSEAILAFLQASKLAPDNVRIKNNLASAYLLNGDEATALAIFKKTVGEAEAYNNLGYLYMTRGEFDKAEKALKKALQTSPKFYARAQENLERLQEMRKAAK